MIKLTKESNGEPIWIAAWHIISMQAVMLADKRIVAGVKLANMRETVPALCVKEKPEYIAEQIRRSMQDIHQP